MFLIISIAVLAVAGLIGTLRALPVDGLRAIPTDPARVRDGS